MKIDEYSDRILVVGPVAVPVVVVAVGQALVVVSVVVGWAVAAVGQVLVVAVVEQGQLVVVVVEIAVVAPVMVEFVARQTTTATVAVRLGLT